MLSSMREGAQSKVTKFLISGILLLGVMGLVMTDIGGFFRSGTGGSGTVAVVAGEKLSLPVFDRTIRRVLSRQPGMDVEMAYRFGLIDRILEAEIASALLRRGANELGLRISDQKVAERIAEYLAPYTDGETDRKTVLEQILRSQSLNEREFTEALRTEMTVELLSSAFLYPSVPSETEARDLHRYTQEKRTVQAIILPDNAIPDGTEPTDEELLPLYQAGQARYAIPEARTITLAILSPDNLKEDIVISDEELQTVYEEDIEAYTLPERRVMEQAVFGDESAAQKAFDDVLAGAALKETATTHGGSHLGEEIFAQKGLLDSVAGPVFSAEKGDVVGPIKTPLGFHVLVIQDILDVETKSFEDVKEDIRKDIFETRHADALFDLSGAIDDRLASGEPLEDVAAALNLKLHPVGAVREDGTTPDGTTALQDFATDRLSILQTAFELFEGESSPVMELSDGSFATIRTDTITPLTYKPFEAVKDDIAKVWKQDKRQVENRLKAQDILRTLGAEEKTLAQVAEANGLSQQIFTLKRMGDTPIALTPQAHSRFFEIATANFVMTPAKDGLAIGKISEVILPAADSVTAEEVASVQEGFANGSQEEYLEAWLTHLRGKYGVKINRAVLEAAYGESSDG